MSVFLFLFLFLFLFFFLLSALFSSIKSPLLNSPLLFCTCTNAYYFFSPFSFLLVMLIYSL
ncbi:hypothetical protein BDF14DRAFT_1790082 [Spinellus fusiger]|nr:hypothetical protein BDF14DRAFT_1790082 [Spinellus fusiger]